VAFVLSLGVATLAGMGLERSLSARRVAASVAPIPAVAPEPGPQLAPPVDPPPAAVVDAGAAPEADAGTAVEALVKKAVEAASPEERDPQRLCKDVAHWRAELLGNVRAIISVYKVKHPADLPTQPPLSELSTLHNQGLAADSVEACVKIQRAIDSWELKHNKT
jgi:hypothetical protein